MRDWPIANDKIEILEVQSQSRGVIEYDLSEYFDQVVSTGECKITNISI